MVISVAPGALISVALVTPPPPGPYLAPDFDPGAQTWRNGPYFQLVDSSVFPPRTLLSFDAANDAFPGAAAVPSD
jgi:hypothetical protein